MCRYLGLRQCFLVFLQMNQSVQNVALPQELPFALTNTCDRPFAAGASGSSLELWYGRHKQRECLGKAVASFGVPNADFADAAEHLVCHYLLRVVACALSDKSATVMVVFGHHRNWFRTSWIARNISHHRQREQSTGARSASNIRRSCKDYVFLGALPICSSEP